MFVTSHAEARLIGRIGQRTAQGILDRLEALAGTLDNVAIEVARFTEARHDPETGSNGDQVVVIAVEGSVETVMLRRSWNQPFTPKALDVDRCISLVASSVPVAL
jgi:hypothetical protein